VRISACVSIFCLGIVLSLQAQDSQSTTPAYLLRIERMRSFDDSCLLVRSDGPYHLEKNDGDKVEVYEGELPPGDLRKLEHWVSVDELFNLTQNKIIGPIFIQNKDEIILGVHRPGYWQNLSFPTLSTREAYRQSVIPLEQWFGEMLKAKHRVKLREEEGRSNCIPPHELKLSTRSAAPKQQVLPDFLFMLRTNQLQGGTGTRSCAIVYPDGHYHHEMKSQKMGSTNVTTTVYEGTLNPSDVERLQAILADPALHSPRSQNPPSGGLMKEGAITSLTVPQGQKPRTDLFWRYVPEGLVGGRLFDESGMKALQPLNLWLTSHFEAEGGNRVVDGPLNDCVPVQLP
jgi:hypothetical protein